MIEPTYKYIPGQGWVPTVGARISILATKGEWAVVYANEVPEGVFRSAGNGDYHDNPVYLIDYSTSYPYVKGPVTDKWDRDSNWLCIVKLSDIT